MFALKEISFNVNLVIFRPHYVDKLRPDDMCLLVNSLCANFFRGNMNMYLHFMSFFHTDMPKIIEIRPHIRP